MEYQHSFHCRAARSLECYAEYCAALGHLLHAYDDHSEVHRIKRRKNEIMMAMSEAGRGNASHRPKGRTSHLLRGEVEQVKAIKLQW